MDHLPFDERPLVSKYAETPTLTSRTNAAASRLGKAIIVAFPSTTGVSAFTVAGPHCCVDGSATGMRPAGWAGLIGMLFRSNKIGVPLPSGKIKRTKRRISLISQQPALLRRFRREGTWKRPQSAGSE